MSNTRPTIAAEIIVHSNSQLVVDTINNAENSAANLPQLHISALCKTVDAMKLPTLTEDGNLDSSFICPLVDYDGVTTKAQLSAHNDETLFQSVTLNFRIKVLDFDLAVMSIVLPAQYPASPELMPVTNYSEDIDEGKVAKVMKNLPVVLDYSLAQLINYGLTSFDIYTVQSYAFALLNRIAHDPEGVKASVLDGTLA